MNVNLSPKHVSSVLHYIGEDVSLWYELFTKLTPSNDFLLYDLTSIYTYSQNIKLAEKGYNSDHGYMDQIGIVMAFSRLGHLPIGIEVYYGSMKDISTIKDFLKRFPERSIGFIFDRGFSSYNLLEDLRNDGLHYIVPLRKNSQYLDLRGIRWKASFTYRKRPIRWSKKKSELGNIYIFEDPKLRGEEESALLRKVEMGRISMKEFEEKRKRAGIIGIISDMNREGRVIFDLYKSREDIELAFDALKNTLDSDKTYMQTTEGVRGYFFVSFLAMRIYFSILKRLREKSLTSRISVEEVLFELSKVEMIVEKSSREYLAKIPKQARKMLSLFPEALPMG